jgi:hypothetical protein
VKVLIVEDDVDLLDLTPYALRRDGYEVVAAVDVLMDGARSMGRGSPEMGNRNATTTLPRLPRPGVTVSGA